MTTVTTVTRKARARRVAGAVFTVTGIATFMGIITGEALYPRRFTTAQNTISDLGGTRPPHSVVFADSRALFVVLTIGAGLLLLVGAAHLALAVGHRTVVAALAVAAIGLVGMGIFPGDVLPGHHLCAYGLVAARGGDLRLKSSAALPVVRRRPRRGLVVAMVLGTDVFDFGPAALGVGGVERWPSIRCCGSSASASPSWSRPGRDDAPDPPGRRALVIRMFLRAHRPTGAHRELVLRGLPQWRCRVMVEGSWASAVLIGLAMTRRSVVRHLRLLLQELRPTKRAATPRCSAHPRHQRHWSRFTPR
ncbi:MAG: DUF998 domain-containing protein [Acidimicrobiia bacterium]